MVAHQRYQAKQEYRARLQPAGFSVGLPHDVGDVAHQATDAARHQQAPRGEGRDEEVVALTHLTGQVRLLLMHGVAVLEVEVVDEQRHDGEEEQEHHRRIAPVDPPVGDEATHAEQGEHGR